MEREQLIEKLEQANDEQRAEMLSWLNDGAGHTVAGLDYYTDKGIPAELVEPMVNRQWSNFVTIPEGITKVAEDVITGRPIGWFDGEDEYGQRASGWKFLLTPQEEENGFLTVGYYSIAEDRTKRLFVESVEEDDYGCPEDEWDEYIKAHRLHPKAQYWSHHWENVCGGCLTIDYRLPVTPTVDRYDDNKERTNDATDSAYYISKYDGRKRTDYYCLSRLVNLQRFIDEGPLTMEAAIERAEAGIARRTEDDGSIAQYVTMGDDSPEYYTYDADSDGGWQKATGFQPVESIAKEYIKFNEEEREWKQRRLDIAFADVFDLERWVKAAKVPPMALGQWRVERFMALGYTDVMWNGSWMTPWVDGVGSHTVINAIKRTLGDEKYSHSIGRGSGARHDAEYLLTYMRENNIVFGDEEE